MATFAMSEATYFSTGDTNEVDFYHYGLAAKFYTHFTYDKPEARFMILPRRKLID